MSSLDKIDHNIDQLVSNSMVKILFIQIKPGYREGFYETLKVLSSQ
jgi:hypothetical protein